MRNKLFILLLILIAQLSFGQIGFEDIEITDFGNLNYYDTVDLNGDNLNDIVTYGGNSIDWYENTGINDQFKRRQNITQDVESVQSIVLLDYDNDGDLDIISASAYDDKIAWYENTDGMGNFGVQQLIATSITAVGTIQLKDMDQDGDEDLVHYGNNLSWLENTGNVVDNFSNVVDIEGNMNYNRFEDIDNDGDLDIFGYSQNSIFWFENEGNYQFGAAQYILNSDYQIYDTDFNDIDNDGDLDVLVLKSSSPLRFNYILNDGAGNFSSEVEIFQATGYHPTVQLDVKDIDSDGDKDFFLVFSTEISWIENLGNYNFSGLNTIITMPDIDDIESNDMDGDGSMDLIIKTNYRSLTLLKGGASTTEFTDSSIITSNVDSPVSVVAKDVNGDGNKDVIFVSEGDRKIGWYEFIGGDEMFGPQRLIHYEPGIPQDIEVFDIDGDGDLDIISIAEGTQYVGEYDSVTWFENDGLGNFSTPNYIDSNTYDENRSLTVFDMDNDGDYDIVVVAHTAFDGDQIFSYENTDGQGNFSSLQLIAEDIGDYSRVFNSDIDGDGDIDLYISSGGADTVSWFSNIDGQGSYGTQQIIADNALAIQGAIATDLDGDGDKDMAYMSNQNENSIFWQENLDGLGNFGSRVLITSNIGVNGANSIEATDLDNDGDQDIIVADRAVGGGSTPDKVIWIENLNGQATFDPPKDITTGVSIPRNIYITDFDNDGDQDIFTTTDALGKLFMHKNLSNVYNEISGYVRVNLVSSGCDETNPTIPNIMVTTESATTTASTFTFENEFSGFYQFFVGSGDYETSINTNLPSYYVSNPQSGSASFNDVNGIETLDFCIEPIAMINDLNIAIYPSQDEPRPGFDTTYQIVYENVGTTQLDGNVTFEFDNLKLQFLNASETVASQTNNTLTFNYAGLDPFETRIIDVAFNVFPPPTTNIDDVLTTTATINPISGDETPENNTFELTQTVIGSYDPNDIRVLEGTQILYEDIDRYLHYIIRFQNTGTASAINVRVDHILDGKLDWTTMQLESLSHEGRVEIINGSEVSFIFNDINLPDSTNDEPNSHGYITFKIKPKDDVIIGDIINAVADIYFDFNPPITTNTAQTEIVENLSVSEVEVQRYWIYPNPTEDILHIKSQQNFDHIRILDINGRTIETISLEGLQSAYQLQLESLGIGMYFLEIGSSNATTTLKFIKN